MSVTANFGYRFLYGSLAGLLTVAGAGCSGGEDASLTESVATTRQKVVVPPPSPLAGNSNYWITAANPSASTGLPITGLTVTIAVTQDLQIPKGLSIQANGWSAPGSNIVWQQYGFSVGGTSTAPPTSPTLGWGIENWATSAYSSQLGISGNSINFPPSLAPYLPALPRSGVLAAGYLLTIVFNNDSRGNITGVTYTVTDSCDVTSSIGPINIVGTSLTASGGTGTIPAGAVAPIYALQLNLVNLPGNTIVFSSGAGSITYSANESLYVSNSQPAWTAAQGIVTAENSSIAYSQLSSTPSNTIVQPFGNSSGVATGVACDWSSSTSQANSGQSFDSIVAGADTDGTALMPCRGRFTGGSVQVGKTRAGWTGCDIGYAGNEQQISPYETLVPGWVYETNGAVPSNALQFGTDGAGGPPLYACRTPLVNKGYQLGKVRPGLGGCAVPYGGAEQTASAYEVLTTSLTLVPLAVSSAPPPTSAAGSQPAAIVGGIDTDGALLYVCQAVYNGGLVPGKTRSNWTNCDVSWGGQEHPVSRYNVLVPKFAPPGSSWPNEYNAGVDTNGNPLGICRALYNGSEQVGKYVTDGRCHFGFGGVENSVPAAQSQVLLF